MDIFLQFLPIFFIIAWLGFFIWYKYYAKNLSNTVTNNGSKNFIARIASKISPKISNNEEITFSHEESLIRKNWLISAYIFVLGCVLVNLGCYCTFVYLGNSELASEILAIGIAEDIGLAITTYAIYHFAYVKSGTKWIGLFILLSPIKNTINIIRGIVETFHSPAFSMFDVYYLSIVFTVVISTYLYFWIHCIRLYLLNRRIKKRKINNEANKLGQVS